MSASRMGMLSTHNARNDPRTYFPFFALFESPAPRSMVQLGSLVDLVQLLALIVNRVQPFGGILRAIALPVYFTILPFWDQHYAVQVGYGQFSAFVWVSLVILAVLIALCGTIMYAVLEQLEKRGLALAKMLLACVTTLLFQPMMHFFLAYTVCTSGGSGYLSTFPEQACVHTESILQIVLFVLSIVGLTVLCTLKFLVTLTNFDDLPTTVALRGRAHNKCEVAFITLQIIAAVLFHYQPSIGQRQAFAGIFAFGCLIVAVLHAFYLPFFNLAMNSFRTAFLLGICYVATVVCIFYHNNETEAAIWSKNWNSLVLIGGFIVTCGVGFVVSRIRVSTACLRALAAAGAGRQSAPKEGAVFPAYLPTEEVVKHRDLEAIILGEVKFHRAQQSLTGPQREREEQRDELWVAAPYIDFIFCETCVELSVRHLREFMNVTALRLPPLMISYALRVYSKGLARFSSSSWLHLQFATFLCCYCPSRNHVALSLCDHINRDESVDTLTLYRTSRRAASIASALMLRDSTSKKSFIAAQQMHKDALHNMKLFWSKLLQDQVDVLQLGALAKVITDRREEGLRSYERIVSESTDTTTIIKYAQFLEQVMMDPDAATTCRETVLDSIEQEQLGVVSKDTSAKLNVKNRHSSASMNRSRTVENLNFNINLIFGVLFAVVIGLFIFGALIGEQRMKQVTKLSDAGSARSHLALLLFHVNQLADAVWTGQPTSAVADQLSNRLIGFRALQNDLTIGTESSKNTGVVLLFSLGTGRLRHGFSHTRVGLWEAGQYVASAVETILDADTNSALSARSVTFMRENALHAASLYNESLVFYIDEATEQLTAGVAAMACFYGVSLLVLGAVYTILIYNFKLIGTSKLSTLSLFTLIPKNALDKLMQEGTERIQKFDLPCETFQKMKVQRGLEDDADAMDQVVREVDDGQDETDEIERRKSETITSKKSLDDDAIDQVTNKFASLAKNSSVADTGKVKATVHGQFETPYLKDQFFATVESAETLKERKKELNDEMVEEDLRMLRASGRGEEARADDDLSGSHSSSSTNNAANGSKAGSREIEESYRQALSYVGLVMCLMLCIAYGALSIRMDGQGEKVHQSTKDAAQRQMAVNALQDRLWKRHFLVGSLVATRQQSAFDLLMEETQQGGLEDLSRAILPRGEEAVSGAVFRFEDAWSALIQHQFACITLVCFSAGLSCPQFETYEWEDDLFAPSAFFKTSAVFSPVSVAPPLGSKVELAGSSAEMLRAATSIFTSHSLRNLHDTALQHLDQANERIIDSTVVVEETDAATKSMHQAQVAIAVVAFCSGVFFILNSFGRLFETAVSRLFAFTVCALLIAMFVLAVTKVDQDHTMESNHLNIISYASNSTRRGVFLVIENALRVAIANDPISAVWLDSDNGGDTFRDGWRLLNSFATAAESPVMSDVFHNFRTVINTALIAAALAIESTGSFQPPVMASLSWNFTNDLLSSRIPLEFPDQIFYTSRAQDSQLPNASKKTLAVGLLLGPWTRSALFEGIATCRDVTGRGVSKLLKDAETIRTSDAGVASAQIGLAFAATCLMLVILFLFLRFTLNQISASRFGEAREDELFMTLTQRSRIVLVVLAVFFSVLFAVTIADFEKTRSSSANLNYAHLREFDIANSITSAQELINSSWQRATNELYSDRLVNPEILSIFTKNDLLGLSGTDSRKCNVSTVNLLIDTNSSVEALLLRGTNLAKRRWKDEIAYLNALTAPSSVAQRARALENAVLPLFTAFEASSAAYASSAKADIANGQVIFFIITAATAILLVVMFLLVFRPMIGLLLNEEEGTKVMLKMIPVEVRESVPAIAEYLETGVVMQDMKVQEINEAASDLSTVPTVTIDTKGVIVKFSRAAEDAFLWTKAEAVGQKVQILMPENIALEHDSYLAAYRKTGVKKIIGLPRKIRAKRKDGTLFPAEISVQEFRNGRNTTFTGTLRNISVEIEFERAIALSTAVSEAATVPIVVINAKGVIQRFNSAAEETFKCSQADVVGRKVNVLMPQAEAEMHDQFLDRYAKTGAKNVIDSRRRARAKKLTGELFPVALYIRELKRGKESLFIGYIEDMTKQVHLQMASMVSDAIMATSPVPLIAIDEAGLVLSWSPAAVATFGLNAHDALQRNIKFLLPDNIAARHDSYLQQYQKTKRKKMVGNTTLVKAKRREEDGSYSLIPVRIAIRDITEQGKGNRFVAFVQDVTSQQILEREYKISSSITNLSSTPLITINEKGICTAFSAAAEECFGYTKAEMIDSNIEILCPPAIRALHDGFLQRYFSTGVKTVVDKTRVITACHKNGKEFQVEINVKEVKHAGKSSFVAHLRNIENVAMMQEANAYNDAISNLTTTPIVVISLEGIILNCSESTCERFAWSRDELIGQNVGVLMPDHVAAKHDGYLQAYKARLASQGAVNARKGSTIINQERRVTARTRDEQQFTAAVFVRDLHIDGMAPTFVGYIRDTTEEMQLSVQKTIADSIVQLSSIPLICIDRLGIIREFSQSAQKDFLYTRAEVQGKNVRMLMPDDIAAKHDGFLRAYTKTGVKNIIDSKRQVLGKKKNGRIFPLEIAVKEVVVKDANGRDTSEYIGFLRDLTQQYILQQAQLINEVVMELATVPIILINTRGTILDFNAAAAREFGYQQSEVISHNIKMIMPDDVAAKHDGYLAQYKATGKKTIIDGTRQVLGKRKGGALFPCEVSVREVVKSGAETQYIGYVRNITSTQLLATQYRVNSAIIDLSATPLLVIDKIGTISVANQAAESTFGFMKGELMGQNIKILMPLEIANQHDKFLSTYQLTGVKNIIDSSRRVTAKKKDGTIFPAEVSVKEIKDNDGESLFIGYISNCTAEVLARAQVEFGECINTVSPVPIISIDHIGTICRFSAAAEDEFGYTSAEIVGKNIKILQTEEVASVHDTYLSRYLATGKKSVIDAQRTVVAKRANGTTFNATITVKEVRTHSSATPSYVGYLKNIDQDLKNQESFLEGRSMMELSPLPVIVLSLNGTIVEVNEATVRTFGYTTVELVGKNIKMLMPPAVAANHDSYLTRYLQTRVKTVIDTVRHVSAVKKSGYQFQCEISVREITIEGIETQYIGYIRDVTEALKMKEASTINEAVSSLSTSPLLVIDPRGSVLKFSSAAEHLFGYTENEIVGQNVKVLMPPSIAGKHDGYLEKYMATGVKKVVDRTTKVSARRKNGEVFPCEIGVREVKNNDNTTAVFIGFVRSLDEAVLNVGQSSEINGLMIDLANQGMVIIDTFGTVERVNDAFNNMFSIAVGMSIVGKNIKVVMPDAIAAKHDEYLANYAATGVKKIIGTKQELFGKNMVTGKSIPLELSIREIIEPGKPTRYLGYIRRLEADLELRVVKKVSATALDLSNYGTIVIDSQGKILLFSRAAEDIFEVKGSEIIGKNVKTLMPPEVASRHDDYLAVYHRTGEKHVIDTVKAVVGKTLRTNRLINITINIRELKFSAKGLENVFVGYVEVVK